MQDWRVMNVDQELVFRGELLAEVSSWTENKGRWTEQRIFKTEGGKYVVTRSGRSDVFHGTTCARARTSDDLTARSITADDLDVLVPCERCRPRLELGLKALIEPDKYFAIVCPTPQQVIAACHRRGSDGIKHLTTVGRELIERAVLVDDQLRETYTGPLVQTVD